MMRRAISCFFFICMSGLAMAVQPGEQLADKALESRARELSAGLRCLVCQNQSIDDSDAPLAKDLRLLVRERLAAGDTDVAVKNFIVLRYGEFVLLNPRLGWNTLLLWLSPFVLLFTGGVALWRRGRHSLDLPRSSSELSLDEKTRLAALLEDAKP